MGVACIAIPDVGNRPSDAGLPMKCIDVYRGRPVGSYRGSKQSFRRRPTALSHRPGFEGPLNPLCLDLPGA